MIYDAENMKMGYRILDCMIDFAGLLFVIAHLLLAAYFAIDKGVQALIRNSCVIQKTCSNVRTRLVNIDGEKIRSGWTIMDGKDIARRVRNHYAYLLEFN